MPNLLYTKQYMYAPFIRVFMTGLVTNLNFKLEILYYAPQHKSHRNGFLMARSAVGKLE